MRNHFLSLLSFTVIGLTLSTISTASLVAEHTKNPNIQGATIHSSQKVIAYFDSIDNDNQYIDHPSLEGFYRILLANNEHGHYLIQDFFQDTAQAQTEPYWVISDEGLTSFGIEYIQGPLIGYFRNGNTSFKGDLNDGEYRKPFESFYPSGKIANRTSALAKGYTQDEYFYENGQRAIIFEYDKEGELVNAQAWDLTGKLLNSEQVDDVETLILDAIRFDQ